MNEEALNMSLRKFLKRVGIGSQRHIEEAVRSGLEDGSIGTATNSLAVKMTLQMDGNAEDVVFEGKIDLA
jgi:hypothetical protein